MRTQTGQQMAETFSAESLDQIATAMEDYATQLKDVWRRARERRELNLADDAWSDMDSFRQAAYHLRIIGGYVRPSKES